MKGRHQRIKTLPAFWPLVQDARYKGAYGGRGSGKSHFFAGLMVDDCQSERGLLCVCIREVQNTLDQSAKRLIEAKIAERRLESEGFKVFRNVIQTPGDGMIAFKGMRDQNAESIKSLEGFKRAWIEEAQVLSSRSLALLRPTIRARGSQIWASWNPRLKSDPIDRLLRGPEIPTGAVVVSANWDQNPWFSDELDKERRDCLRLQPDQYAHIWEGDYVSVAEGAYFARQLAEARTEGRIGVVKVDPLMKLRVFVDIGGTGARSDAFAMWVVQFVNKEIRVLDYYETQGQDLATHLHWLRSNDYGPDRASIWLPHDGATQDRVHDASFERAFFDARYDVEVVGNQGRGAATARIEAARRLFPIVRFNAATTGPGLEALGWYHERRDTARGIGLGPQHDWSSHAADAFGLMCVAYEEPRERVRRVTPVARPGGWMG